MNKYQNNAKIAGLLFLVAMFASLFGGGLIESVFAGPESVNAIADNKTLILAGILLELLNAVAVVGIAGMLFPILRRHNEGMALCYLAFRVLEAVFCSLMVLAPLSLLELSDISAPDLQIISTLEFAQRAAITDLLIPVFFCLGAFLFYTMLLRYKLLPGFIAIWGLIAVILVMILNFMSITLGANLVLGMVFALPIILNEIFMGIWLMAKGFNPTAAFLES